MFLEGACLHSCTNGKGGRYLPPGPSPSRQGRDPDGRPRPSIVPGPRNRHLRRGASDYDAGVVIRFVLAQRGTRVLDLGQRRGSRSPCGRKNIQPTSGIRIYRKKAFCELRRDGVLRSSQKALSTKFAARK
jgi:hypothetical protein